MNTDGSVDPIPVATAMSDEDGEFWFEDVTPGQYLLTEDLDNSDGFGHCTDLNDLNGDGAPDGDGICDGFQGLTPSTPNAEDGVLFTINSGQEYVWEPGAAGLDNLVWNEGGSNPTFYSNTLKEELLAFNPTVINGQITHDGTGDLLFGNYYAGHIYGTKVHSDTGNPIAGIPILLYLSLIHI